MSAADPNTPSLPHTTIAEVKYSLPELLEEIKLERAADTFAMEKLDHNEIDKLFKATSPKKRRAKSKN